MTVLADTGHTEPRLTPGQVKTRVDRLHQEAEEATERYNGAKEKADALRDEIENLQDEVARRTDGLSRARDDLGRIATAQYRGGGMTPVMQLGLDADPDGYLQRVGLMDRMADRQATALNAYAERQRQLKQLRDEAEDKLGILRATQAKLSEHKHQAEAKLAESQRLLHRLTADQRANVLGDDVPARAAGRTSSAPASPQAAQAVAFARNAIGAPYVWGATGPSAFDCSGLTQAAWRAAGVWLPRTSYSQINAGQRVSRSELQPGDLVFFYSGISHVGLYIGDGQMIHAPRPGASVRVDPIDQMPFAGATRPA